MTFIVVLVLAACLIAGLVILFLSARKVKSSPVDPTCPRCGTANRARAKFCAHCGATIESQNKRAL
jgi:predicted amidophosphoribosyltransferase